MERLRGAARATQPRTQKVLFEMGRTVMSPLLTLLEVYKNHVMLFFKHHRHRITLQVNVEDHAINLFPVPLVHSRIHDTKVCGGLR